MCYLLYLGADRELPTIEQDDPNSPAFFVIAESSPSTQLRKHLQSTYIYYIGSYEGCGCGFCYESSTELDALLISMMPDKMKQEEREDRQACISSVDSLRNYLTSVTQYGPVKLLVTWCGPGRQPPHHVTTVTPDHFGGDQFSLEEDTLFEVIHHT
ncbi:MAG: hypothetical protein BWY76_00255 [bacterium ADurb.Bin429]|nr:MAG: hypothetical protein BWY76_00255 [bacterium ADurb.Bin429]